MKNKDVHVTGNRKDGYTVKSSDATRAAGHFDTQKEAIDRAREIARNKESEVVVHGTDGKIRQKDSHGNDPHPPEG